MKRKIRSVIPEEKTFRKFDLSPEMLSALQAAGYHEPTPIQAGTIAPALAGRDVIGTAQTGTGKTAAFLVPVVERLRHARRGGEKQCVLILAPTRELAEQTYGWSQRLGSGLPASLIVGGVAYGPQYSDLRRKPAMLIATPGRLVDHLDRGSVSLRNVRILVLDEADRMLDMGFKPQVDRILGSLPSPRQTLLFSATLANEVTALARKQTKDPVRVAVGPQSMPPSQTVQDVYLVESHRKRPLLLSLLEQDDGNILVFARTKHRTDRLAHGVRQAGHAVQRLHSDRSQSQRREAMDGFRNGRYRVLVATDIAARGIDVAGIRRVINFDLPQTVEDYVHRVGRTARADADGHASSFVAPEERGQLRAIEQHIGRSLPRRRHDDSQQAPYREMEVQHDQERRSPPVRSRNLGDRGRHRRERQGGIMVGDRRRVSGALS
jgi:ATP-dependent RNA helicase RhlE